MSRNPTGPDDVTAPAADTRLFRLSPTWVTLILLCVAVPVAAFASLSLELLDDAAMSRRLITAAVVDVLPYTVVARPGGGLAARPAPDLGADLSSGGMELAA